MQFAHLVDHLVLELLELLVVLDGYLELLHVDAVRSALEVELAESDLLLDARMEDNEAVVVEHDDVDADAHLVLGRHLADETQHGHVDAHDAEQRLLFANLELGVAYERLLLVARLVVGGRHHTLRILVLVALLHDALVVVDAKAELEALVRVYLIVGRVVAERGVAEGGPRHRYLQLFVQVADEHVAPRGLAHARQRHGPREHRYVLVHVLVDVRERDDVIVLAVVGARELLDLARVGHVAADLEGEDAYALVAVVLGEEVVDVVGVAVRDDHDHLVAAGALETLVAEQIEHLLERSGQFGLLARVLEGVEALLELELVLLARLYERVRVGGLVVQQVLHGVGEREYVEEVVVGEGVENELDELLGDLQAQTGHGAARVEQNEHVLGRGGRHDVPGLEATVEEVLAARHRPVGGRIAAEEALRAAKVLPEELVVGVVVALELLVERLGPVGGHVDGDVLLEDVDGHLDGRAVAVDALHRLEVLVLGAIDARYVPVVLVVLVGLELAAARLALLLLVRLVVLVVAVLVEGFIGGRKRTVARQHCARRQLVVGRRRARARCCCGCCRACR